MPDEAHPFVPGTKVTITHRYGGIRVGVVDKAHKTGRFTLTESSQQWRPWKNWASGDWEAVETGGGYTRSTLHVWTEADDAVVAQMKRTREAGELIDRLRRHVAGISEVSLAELRAIVEREGG